MKKNVVQEAARAGKIISGNRGNRELRRTVSGELSALRKVAESATNIRWAAVKGQSKNTALYSVKVGALKKTKGKNN